MRRIFSIFIVCSLIYSCRDTANKISSEQNIVVYETNSRGKKLDIIKPPNGLKPSIQIQLKPDVFFQKINGFGGAMTEASAHLLLHLDEEARNEVVKAYFSDEGAKYSLVRTHINSCDFSLNSYAYLENEEDSLLEEFSVDEDLNDIIPMLKLAQEHSSGGFKILASPWTAPPYMKDNRSWFGGKLLRNYYSNWAKYFVKYIQSYEDYGLPIWALTVENEPMGNDSNWESMHFSPEEMATFVKGYLYPEISSLNSPPKLYIYDQNKGEELVNWSNYLLKDSTLRSMVEGTAVHWYSSTFEVFEESLQKTHYLAPEKDIIHSEACIDAEKPVWDKDEWYWEKNATDWGWDWAAEEDKVHHPKYAPVSRYANDIIGCMNNWVSAWIDWNMVLDPEGGPNHAKNWCIAPVIADTTKNEVYKTPLYYVMAHFSRFIPPNSNRIEWSSDTTDLKMTAFKTPDEKVVLVIFNEQIESYDYTINLVDKEYSNRIEARAIQTIVINTQEG